MSKTLKIFLIIIAFTLTFVWILMLYLGIMVNTENKILKGYYKSVEHWDTEGFRDYLDYCKYFYKDDPKFRTNKYYHKVTKESVEEIHNRFKEIERWMKICNRLDEYDFDYSKISIGDYYYLDGGSYDNYTIYFFDVESNILYYAHINT